MNKDEILFTHIYTLSLIVGKQINGTLHQGDVDDLIELQNILRSTIEKERDIEKAVESFSINNLFPKVV